LAIMPCPHAPRYELPERRAEGRGRRDQERRLRDQGRARPRAPREPPRRSRDGGRGGGRSPPHPGEPATEGRPAIRVLASWPRPWPPPRPVHPAPPPRRAPRAPPAPPQGPDHLRAGARARPYPSVAPPLSRRGQARDRPHLVGRQ